MSRRDASDHPSLSLDTCSHPKYLTTFFLPPRFISTRDGILAAWSLVFEGIDMLMPFAMA